MISSQQIIDRLNAQNAIANFARAIDELQSAPGTIDGFTTSPMVLVEVPSETAAFNEAGTGVTRNPTDIRFRVFAVLTGNTFGNADIEAVRDGIKAALIGWTPDSEIYDPINPVSAGIMDQDKVAGYVRFVCLFSSHYTQRTP